MRNPRKTKNRSSADRRKSLSAFTCFSDRLLVRRFAERFLSQEWPGSRLPILFYDPRSLEMDSSRRACLHAKCVLIDHEQAFVSSANFTEAAQQRNIEVGVLIRSRSFTTRLVEHFEAMASAGLLKPVPGT